MVNYRAAIVGLSGIAADPSPIGPDPVLGELMPHSHVAAYAHIPNTTVVAVCDLVPSLIEQFREQWGRVFPESHAYTDYREMLANEQIDLLSVVTPDHRHAQIVVDGLEAGVKGIFCEKPIATTLADADRIITACKQRNVPLLIDHTRRWYPEFLEARRLVRSGAIGPLRRIVANLSGPRAMLFRNGTHLVDAICLFAESEPLWVSAELDDEHADYGPRYAGDGGRDPATDPGGSAIVHFANGVRAFVNASKGTPMNFELDLLGATGRLRIGTHVGEIWQFHDGRPAIRALRPPHTTRGDMVAAIEELIGLIEHGGPGSSTGEDGRRVLSILLAILQSSATGGSRILFPVSDR
ncbi:MAG TPA: Gfo/Idh/MocA family oxidoreductase [Chloroflexota bacterium]|nr:Gfo/Idh/MocA family oxidoreductase [Chloroflexota bacterium]